MGDILLAKNIITQEQYEQGTDLINRKGFRHGRALVEIGAISPKQLWQTISEQMRNIASSVIPWESGEFEFTKKEIRQKEAITLSWPIMDMVLDVVRNLSDAPLFRKRFPNRREILRLVENSATEDIKLENYEEYVLKFLDGKRSIADICEQSDYGELESLRVLYLIKCLGWTETVPQVSNGKVHPMVANYNKIFGFTGNYLSERVGKVGPNLLKKYFEDTCRQHPTIFGDVTLLDDGRINPGEVQANLDQLNLEDDQTLMMLDDGLNEYLNVCILAVTKLLGPEHEAVVVQQIGEIG